MFSKKVFCGATSPLFPPGILGSVGGGQSAVDGCDAAANRRTAVWMDISRWDGEAHCNPALLQLLQAHCGTDTRTSGALHSAGSPHACHPTYHTPHDAHLLLSKHAWVDNWNSH
ncbi:hypothetical protein DPEC_G00292290 [Dallia pectoralis]|uniref:Uncharacterized protein n=1 Tax=Dallia pectoralis TaxID=75939 RepID=A0ACC2FI67_DALPE|nr:hypothetical protein DPEC_G00292290 [Dallia pectoralis]